MISIDYFLLRSYIYTEILGVLIAKILSPGLIFYLSGKLGTGKTTLVRGILRGLGYQGITKSPTFTLLETYLIKGLIIHHWDFYRLKTTREVDYLGLHDQIDNTTIIIVEWPEHGLGKIPVADIELQLCYGAQLDYRICRVNSNSIKGNLIQEYILKSKIIGI